MEFYLSRAPHLVVVFIRLSVVLLVTPFFNNRNYIAPIKAGMAFLFSLLLLPSLDLASWTVPPTVPGFLVFLLQEMAAGILIGLVTVIVFFSAGFVGHLVGFQMSFTMASSFDPSFGEQTDILSAFAMTFATMIFLTMNGDHLILKATAASFRLLPPGRMLVHGAVLPALAELFTHSFAVGMRLAAPALILLLLTDLTLGILGKASTKMQVFFVGIPLKIAVGLFCFTALLGLIVSLWSREIRLLPDYLVKFIGMVRY